MTLTMKALLASGALLLTTGAALAANATATTNVKVRSGPAQSYDVVDVLPEGETVNLIGCDDVWCEISMGRDGTGFALAELLDFNGRVPPASFGGEVAIEEDDPVIVRGLVIGGYWDNRPYYIRDGYYYWGGRWYGARPGLRGWRERSWRRWEDRRAWGGRDRDRRWADRRPGDSRGGFDNRPPRVDNPRGDRGDGRFEGRGGDRDREGRAGRDDRGDRGDRMQRGGDGEGRMQRMERSDRAEARSEPRDRGDRMGLDRAGGGGGGRGDGGGRGGGGGGGGDGRGGGGGGGGGKDR